MGEMSREVGGSIASRSKVNIRGESCAPPSPPSVHIKKKKVSERVFVFYRPNFCLCARKKDDVGWVVAICFDLILSGDTDTSQGVTLPEPSSLVVTSGHHAHHFKATILLLFVLKKKKLITFVTSITSSANVKKSNFG